MPRRMGRPGLVGTMARTAVIAGTGTAVSGGMQNRAAQRSATQQQAAAAEQQAMVDQAAAQAAAQLSAQQAAAAPAPAPAPAAAPAASGSSMDDKIAKLKELGGLRDAGILTDAEFEAQKATVLAG